MLPRLDHAFLFAARNGQLGIVNWAIDQGVNINCADVSQGVGIVIYHTPRCDVISSSAMLTACRPTFKLPPFTHFLSSFVLVFLPASCLPYLVAWHYRPLLGCSQGSPRSGQGVAGERGGAEQCHCTSCTPPLPSLLLSSPLSAPSGLRRNRVLLITVVLRLFIFTRCCLSVSLNLFGFSRLFLLFVAILAF